MVTTLLTSIIFLPYNLKKELFHIHLLTAKSKKHYTKIYEKSSLHLAHIENITSQFMVN